MAGGRMTEIGVLTHPFEALFDAVPDTVFFMKDAEGRYTSVNQTLVQRLGRRSKTELIGCTACDVFPAPLGARILAQDRQIAAGGRPLHSVLELHLYPGGAEGWCLTWKEPVRDAAGRIAGLAGLSRDLQIRAEGPSEFTGISAALAHIRDHLDGSLKLGDVARQAGLISACEASSASRPHSTLPGRGSISRSVDCAARPIPSARSRWIAAMPTRRPSRGSSESRLA